MVVELGWEGGFTWMAAMLETRFTGSAERPRLLCTYTTNTRKIREAVMEESGIGTVARLIASQARAPKSLAVKLARAIRKAWREAVATPPQAAAGEPEPAVQLDTSLIQRPEFFVGPGLVGLTVPVTVAGEKGGVGQWLMFLCRRGPAGAASRGCMPFRSVVGCAGESGVVGSVYLEPSPGSLGANADPRWSRASRDAWLSVSPQALTISELFGCMEGLFAEQLDLSGGGVDVESWARVLTCWVVLTYVYSLFDTVPYLLVQGAPGSGKTKLLEVLAEVCFRPMVTSNVTASALFRTLNERGGTMLFDEAEEIGTRGASEVRNILLAGYRKFGKATRVDGSDGARDYHVFGPKAIAAINHPGPVLGSRCVVLTLLRRSPELPPLPALSGAVGRCGAIRDGLHCLALSRLGWDLRGVVAACPYSGRTADLWSPLLALADWFDRELGLSAGAAWRSSLLAVAKYTVEGSHAERLPEGDLVVLGALRQLVKRGQAPTATGILELASRCGGEPVKGWTSGRVSQALRRYGIVAHRSHGITRYEGLSDATFVAVEARWSVEVPLAEPLASVAVGQF